MDKNLYVKLTILIVGYFNCYIELMMFPQRETNTFISSHLFLFNRANSIHLVMLLLQLFIFTGYTLNPVLIYGCSRDHHGFSTDSHLQNAHHINITLAKDVTSYSRGFRGCGMLGSSVTIGICIFTPVNITKLNFKTFLHYHSYVKANRTFHF